MSKKLVFSCGSALVALLAFAWPAQPQPPAGGGAPGKAPPNAARVKRGEYLVTFGGCNDCHTPMKFDPAIGMPVPDRTQLLAGHPAGAPDPGGTLGPQDQALIGPMFTSFRAPFGVVYSANLTPDRETGLGSWTEKDFVQTLRTGLHLGAGRQILPPMPWLDLGVLTDDDLGAMFAYLQSIPPVKNAVPPPKVEASALAGVKASFDKIRAQRPPAKP